jgi:hypothetical protein
VGAQHSRDHRLTVRLVEREAAGARNRVAVRVVEEQEPAVAGESSETVAGAVIASMNPTARPAEPAPGAVAQLDASDQLPLPVFVQTTPAAAVATVRRSSPPTT